MSDSVQPHSWQPTRLPHPWDSPGKNTGVSCHFLLQCRKVKSESEVSQSCLTPSDPMDSSLPGFSVHEIFQARILEQVAIAFSMNRSLVFLILLFSSISLHRSLKKAFLSLLTILWNSAFKWVYLSFSPMRFTSLFTGTSLVAQMVKNLSTMQETQLRSLGWEDPLEKAMAPHSSTLAWKIPWTEEPARLQSMGSLGVRQD